MATFKVNAKPSRLIWIVLRLCCGRCVTHSRWPARSFRPMNTLWWRRFWDCHLIGLFCTRSLQATGLAVALRPVVIALAMLRRS